MFEVVKFKESDFELDVNVSPAEDTVWLTKEQISLLFERERSVITKHINNIYKERELDKETTCAKNAHMGSLGVQRYNVELFNLDVIISVGYRVKSKRGVLFRKWANGVLKEYLLKGYAINGNRVIVTNENYIRLTNEVASINNRLLKIEDKVFDKDYNKGSIFFNGEFYDAYTLIQSLFEKANNEIIIIDNYIDRTILDRLAVKKKDVNVIIYTNKSKLLKVDIDVFSKQYHNLIIINTNLVHDRYIIIDKDKLYHLGSSIKDLGKKVFSVSLLDNKLIKTLLNYL